MASGSSSASGCLGVYWAILPESIYDKSQYANNRAEQSHEPTKVRERGMSGPAFRRFKSVGQAQRFLGAHAAGYNLFHLGRYLVTDPDRREKSHTLYDNGVKTIKSSDCSMSLLWQ